LRAIAAQTVVPDEVLVVDNNSTDNSRQIARQFPFVKLLREQKQGVLFAKNTGLKNAKGDIIGRIDSERVLTPRRIELVNNLRAHGR
jgi:glycosyltransferase involved in cell wall biosynthesis